MAVHVKRDEIRTRFKGEFSLTMHAAFEPVGRKLDFHMQPIPITFVTKGLVLIKFLIYSSGRTEIWKGQILWGVSCLTMSYIAFSVGLLDIS